MISVNTNVSSLVAQDSLNRTSNLLGQSLQRLSTGLKINSGADGPAALVISQEQQAQITGLNQAITNTSEATSVVQTAEGGLSTINDLLNQLRGLALDSANSGVNDPTANAANQAEVNSALSTIDQIAQNTQFGTKNILNGAAGLTGSASNGNISFLNALAGVSTAGSYAVNITAAAQKAQVVASAANTGVLAANENLNINGVNIGLTQGQNQAAVINTINGYQGQTGVKATDFQTTVTSATNYTDTSNAGAPATAASTLGHLTQGVGGVNFVASNLTISGTDGDGTAVSGTPIAITANTTLNDVLDKINGTNNGGHNVALTKIFNHATASIVGGKIVLTSNATTGDPLATSQNFGLSLSDSGADVTWAPISTYGGDTTRLQSLQFGSGATVNVTSNVAASGTSSGFGAGSGAVHGADIAGNFNGLAATGTGNILTGNTGTAAAGISISAGLNTADAISTVTGNQGTVNVVDNSLIFQIGANANQTVKVGINSVATQALGLNVAGNQFGNLSQINIQTQSGAQDAIKVIDAAISQVSTLDGGLGAVQSQTLSENAANLQTTLTNTTSAESVIRDTNFAAETANYSRDQVLMQVGTSVLANSNQISSLVTRLFQ